MKSCRTLTLLGFLLLNVNLYSQSIQKYNETYQSTTTVKSSAEDVREYYKNYQSTLGAEYDGTYQFIITGTEKISITTEMKNLIEQNRSKSEETFVTITPGIKVRILSYRFIKSKKFSPIKEPFIFE